MKKTIAGAVAALMLAIAPAAGALTIGDAGRDAANYQRSLCNNSGGCVNGTYVWPRCTYSGVNRDHYTEWNCLGSFEMNDGFGYIQCLVYSGWGPYGGRIYGYEGTCGPV